MILIILELENIEFILVFCCFLLSNLIGFNGFYVVDLFGNGNK